MVEDSIYMDPAAHGKGLGRALLEQVIAAAGQADLHTIVGGIDAAFAALGDPARRNPVEPSGNGSGPMGPTRMAFAKPVIAAKLLRVHAIDGDGSRGGGFETGEDAQNC